MAGPAVPLRQHLDPHRVLVAVDARFDEYLHLAAGLALLPQGPSRTAIIMRFAGLQGEVESFGVHPGQHEDLAGLGMGGHRRNQAVGVEAGRQQGAVLQGGDVGGGGKKRGHGA